MSREKIVEALLPTKGVASFDKESLNYRLSRSYLGLPVKVIATVRGY